MLSMTHDTCESWKKYVYNPTEDYNFEIALFQTNILTTIQSQ